MWDIRVQEKLEDMVGTFFVLVQWQGMVDGFIWACSGVYGPNENSERGVIWNELVFSNIGIYYSALGIPISYVFQLSGW